MTDLSRCWMRAGLRHLIGCAVAAACLAAMAAGADEPAAALPALRAPIEDTEQNYSYYYVPRLSELNQLVGSLMRGTRLRTVQEQPPGFVQRYAAYSCQGTFFIGEANRPAVARDIDWAAVRGLRIERGGAEPALVIETATPARPEPESLLLYAADATVRYELHQMLAVLVSECRAGQRRLGHGAGR
ncbi:MAG: hypothetical protein JSR54_09300 [Proteobacteria bacterium]|nr:hypothetical protein [Pseudomonadota bacterium]